MNVIDDTGFVPLEVAEQMALPRNLAISPTPFGWPSAASIPRREWLYGRHLIRGFLSATIAPGGIGKSSLVIADALAMVTGEALLGTKPVKPLNVWIWNGEDPLDELQRRVMATAKHFQIEGSHCQGKLYLDSGRDMQILVAKQASGGTVVQSPNVRALIDVIADRKIDVMIVDPFVSCHEVPENDNNSIDRVAKTWMRIAHKTGCAIELVHHSRKTGGEEVTIEHARGAVALIAAARSARVLNVMTEEEGKQAEISGSHRRFFNSTNGKSNLSPPPDGKFWYEIQGVDLGNESQGLEGDNIGVVTPWRWPDPMADMSVDDLRAAQKAVSQQTCRADSQSSEWAGFVIAQELGIETRTADGKAKVKSLLAIWLKNGMFKTVRRKDKTSRERTYLEVAQWAS